MLLQLPYALNVLLLAPVCYALYFRAHAGGVLVFDAMVPDSPALRLALAGFWTSVVLCSAIGFLIPRLFAPVLLLQFLAEVLFAASWLAPLVWRRGFAAVPRGAAARCAMVVLFWPWFIWNAI